VPGEENLTPSASRAIVDVVMSALDQKQTSHDVLRMSALPRKADTRRVTSVPNAELSVVSPA
jgi:hypothetical protein